MGDCLSFHFWCWMLGDYGKVERNYGSFMWRQRWLEVCSYSKSWSAELRYFQSRLKTVCNVSQYFWPENFLQRADCTGSQALWGPLEAAYLRLMQAVSHFRFKLSFPYSGTKPSLLWLNLYLSLHFMALNQWLWWYDRAILFLLALTLKETSMSMCSIYPC